MVLVIGIIFAVFFGFLIMSTIGAIQDALNPVLETNYVVDEGYFDAFSLAATFVTTLWTYIIAILLFILAYWMYIYSQRRSVGY